jgi:hypothetical protein
LGPDLQSGAATRKRVVLKMNTTLSMNRVADVPAYAELQRTVHDALLVQHPEWVERDGNCPTCDDYDRRLAELLGLSLAFNRGGVR